MYFWFVTIWLAVVNAKTTFDQLPSNVPVVYNKLAGAHISYTNYKMIYHIDLTDYYKLRNTINETISLANDSCSQQPTREMCEAVILQLQSQLSQVTQDDVNMGAMRERRAVCPWCGTVINHAYGTLTEEQGQNITDALNSNSNETMILHNLMLNQTSLFQVSLKTNKRTTERIQSGMRNITEYLNETRARVSENEGYIKAVARTQSLTHLATTAFGEHSRMHSQLRRALTDAKNHRIPELISTETLKKDLETVAALIKPTQRLPIDLLKEKPLRIFKYASVTSFLIDNRLLMEIMIPIAETESYSLYRATPVPFTTEHGRLILHETQNHFLLSADKTKFIQISQGDIDDSKMLSPSEFLYQPTASTHLKYENNCIWRLLLDNTLETSFEICKYTPFPLNDAVLTIIENESYFLTSMNGTTVWEMCNDNEEQRNVRGQVIITLDPDCYIKTSTFILKPHKTHVFNQTKLIVPELAISNASISILKSLSKNVLSKYNFTVMTPIVIQNPEEMQNLIESTAQMVKQADHEYKFENLKLQTSLSIEDAISKFKISSLVTWALSSSGILIVIGLIVLIIFARLNVFSTILRQIGFSPKLTREGGVIVNLTQTPQSEQAQRRYPNTPHMGRTQPPLAPQYDEEWQYDDETQQ